VTEVEVAPGLLLVVLCGALSWTRSTCPWSGRAASIGASLHLSADALAGIVSGYILGYGSLLLLGGRASDLLGRRSYSLPPSPCSVRLRDQRTVVQRPGADRAAIREGRVGRVTVPAGLSIITTTFAEGPVVPGPEYLHVCGASGFSLGLVVGGVLTELGWRTTFLVPGPLAIALVGRRPGH